MYHEADNNPGERTRTTTPNRTGWSHIPETPSPKPDTPEPRNTEPEPVPAGRSQPVAAGRSQPVATEYPGKQNLRYLALPDGLPGHDAHRSPPVTAFKDPLVVPPIAEPESEPPEPAPNGRRHQWFGQYRPEKYYVAREHEFQTRLHSDYGKVTWTWGVDGSRPGPTYRVRYGEPILLRRFNNLPPTGTGNVGFGKPSTTRCTRGGHHGSPSGGHPDDWTETGDFWDHHFAAFPATVADPRSGKRIPDEREKLTTLWYHDNRRGHSAPNVYAGLVGTQLLFDDQDSGDENDPNRYAWRLPSGEYDVPLILQDLRIDENRQLVWEPRDTTGQLGDRFTVNGVIQPHFKVKRRKYRFRIINASVSRYYRTHLNFARNDTGRGEDDRFIRMIAITGDGGILPEPLEAESIVLAPGQRVDVIVDFSRFCDGDLLYLENRLAQTSGSGPDGRDITDPESIRQARLLRFDVGGGEVADPSRIPDYFRPFPQIEPSEIVRERRWSFDDSAGLSVINGKPSDADRIDAGVEVNTAEKWTLVNCGNTRTHPVHSQLNAWLVQEVNDVPVTPDMVQIAMSVTGPDDFQRVFTKSHTDNGEYVPGTNVLRGPFCGGYRRDTANLAHRTEITMYSRWPDFLGRYNLHSGNLAHRDRAMAARWEVLPPGRGFDGSKAVPDVYGASAGGM